MVIDLIPRRLLVWGLFIILVCGSGFLTSGCNTVVKYMWKFDELLDPEHRFSEKYARAPLSESDRLTPAYVYALSAVHRNMITWSAPMVCDHPDRTPVVDANGKRVELILRGIRPTGDPKIDKNATRMLSAFCNSRENLHLLKSSVIDNGNGQIKGLVYSTLLNRRQLIHSDGKIEDLTKIEKYLIIQVEMLMNGNSLLDTSDPECPEFERLRLAEEFAKKHRKGYWKDHPPAD